MKTPRRYPPASVGRAALTGAIHASSSRPRCLLQGARGRDLRAAGTQRLGQDHHRRARSRSPARADGGNIERSAAIPATRRRGCASGRQPTAGLRAARATEGGRCRGCSPTCLPSAVALPSSPPRAGQKPSPATGNAIPGTGRPSDQREAGPGSVRKRACCGSYAHALARHAIVEIQPLGA
jgi:hypothetical protein